MDDRVVTQAFQTGSCFGELTIRQYAWDTILTGDQYINSLRTFSSHAGKDEVLREKLYARLLQVIEQHGGQFDQPRLAVLFQAQVNKQAVILSEK
jgi:hypothetical protein